MTENNEAIEINKEELLVNNNCEVEGSISVFNFVDGYDVSGGVISYSYDRNGETKMNHVPRITVSKVNGEIVAEPHAHDSNNPYTAIENVVNAIEYVVDNPEEFVE